ncbi:hypothetical protein B7463_g7050, partial [Scytalidium lignicola]
MVTDIHLPNSAVTNSTDVSTRNVKSRAPIACQTCRSRKVRCNIAFSGPPCMNCKLDDIECIVAQCRRGRRFRREGKNENSKEVIRYRSSRTQRHVVSSSSTPTTDCIPSRVVADVGRVGDAYMPDGSNDISAANAGPQDFRSTNIIEAPPQRCSPGASDLSTAVQITQGGIPDETVQSISILDHPSNSTELPSFVRPLPLSLNSLDIEYLKNRRVFNIPSLSSRNALIEGCFTFVDYFMPSLQRRDFLYAYNGRSESHQPDQGDQRISLLLLYAMMFTGSAFVDMSILTTEGFNTRREAHAYFYARTKILYDRDVELDRIVQLQALLLMSFWYENPNDGKDAWYWIGAAISLLQIMGLSENANSENQHSRLFKRLWWSCYIRDVHVALSMRLPSRLKQTVPMLRLEDLDDYEFDENPEERRPSRAIICVETAKLSVCTSHVLCSDELPKNRKLESEVHLLDTELTKWFNQLPRECLQPITHQISNLNKLALSVGRTLMLMTYYTTLNALHLPQVLASALLMKSGKSLSLSMRNSYKTVQDTALEVSLLAENSIKYGLVHYIPAQGIGSVFPAVSTYLLNLKSRDPNAPVEKVIAGVSSVLEKIGVQVTGLSPVSNCGTSPRRAGIDTTRYIRRLNDDEELEEIPESSIFSEYLMTGLTDSEFEAAYNITAPSLTQSAITPPADSTYERQLWLSK